jgi:hypothetical protein
MQLPLKKPRRMSTMMEKLLLMKLSQVKMHYLKKPRNSEKQLMIANQLIRRTARKNRKTLKRRKMSLNWLKLSMMNLKRNLNLSMKS